MAHLLIVAPQLDDLNDLLAFEEENRAFFEASINARPPSYYSSEGVAQAIVQAQQDAEADRGYQFLIRESGLLVGRINLHRVQRPYFNCAELGYRVGARFTGRGIAKNAVTQVLQRAFEELRLSRIEANARPENIGSVRVLEASGFSRYGHSRRSFQLHGQWFDRLHYECHSPLLS
ncbi:MULTISPECIES: GNAT family N-acetyltransferase [unclassified Pseudomonas]|uniref:GNAT family N-acetyltransferase n=1 Tax=unclassified Pseudomonas TaxID=196821 RepID=UPI00083907B8|nr:MULTISPECIES: GNAT family N-acetyltransferase [unclassified Pseudomonas]QIH10816.1 GNAT family N-acetyltransferase [Pseudomonas sp. BIOMIG1BAC]